LKDFSRKQYASFTVFQLNNLRNHEKYHQPCLSDMDGPVMTNRGAKDFSDSGVITD